MYPSVFIDVSSFPPDLSWPLYPTGKGAISPLTVPPSLIVPSPVLHTLTSLLPVQGSSHPHTPTPHTNMPRGTVNFVTVTGTLAPAPVVAMVFMCTWQIWGSFTHHCLTRSAGRPTGQTPIHMRPVDTLQMVSYLVFVLCGLVGVVTLQWGRAARRKRRPWRCKVRINGSKNPNK